MKFKLINQPNENYSAIKQVLINRGFAPKEIDHYMNLSDADINDPEIFGEELLAAAASALKQAIDSQSDTCVIIDCDCDGYTSSAILINYLYDLDPDFTENHIHYYMHEGKQHGLSDCMDWIGDIGPNLVIIPDAGSNDVEYMEKLYKDGRKIIVLDHHELEVEPYEHCILINSQSPEYPNKELSGAGVVYQFCRYLDKIWHNNYADWYLDLVALGLDGDMMSLKSPETRWLIFKGLKPENIHNPFIYEMWQKNKFKLGDEPTAWGATFYIVPFVNAITRSGTMEEKNLIFNSMLKFKAFEEILSNKRGHKQGEKEMLVTQAIRTCTNVKNRQTRAETQGLELIESLIEKNHMMEHKVLLFLLEPGAIKAEIRGLVANKLMAKYQRPCCILTKTTNIIQHTYDDCPGVVVDEYIYSYQGSARGCDKVGVTNFKDICAATQCCDYTIGHQGAFGLGITAGKQDEFEGEVFGENILQFIDKTDEILKDMPNEPIYYVDYIWTPQTASKQAILDIAELSPYWGKDIEIALVVIQDVKVNKDNLIMMASNTVKITLPNGISLIKFKMSDEEYDMLYSDFGYVEINVIGECNINEWGGNKYAQILIKDYEIIGKCAYEF